MNSADMYRPVFLAREVREQLVRDWKSLGAIVAAISQQADSLTDEQLVEFTWQLRGTLACMRYRAVS